MKQPLPKVREFVLLTASLLCSLTTFAQTQDPCLVVEDFITSADEDCCGIVTEADVIPGGSMGTDPAQTFDFSDAGNPGRIGVAYNPIEDVYYIARGGNPSFLIITYAPDGTQLASIAAGVDVRGLWWNPNTNSLQANLFGTAGYTTLNLDGSGFPDGTSTSIITGQNQPMDQSSGSYNPMTDEVVFFDGVNIVSHDLQTGTQNSSVAVSGLPVGNMVSPRIAGFSGIAMSEVLVFDPGLMQVHLIDLATGAYQSSVDVMGLPSNGNFNSGLEVDFENNFLFAVDNATTIFSFDLMLNSLCEDAEYTFDPALDGTCFPVGTTEVSVTIESNGVTNMTSFNITVIDDIEPEIDCPENASVSLDDMGSGSFDQIEDQFDFSDNCVEEVDFFPSQEDFSCEDLGQVDLVVVAGQTGFGAGEPFDQDNWTFTSVLDDGDETAEFDFPDDETLVVSTSSVNSACDGLVSAELAFTFPNGGDLSFDYEYVTDDGGFDIFVVDLTSGGMTMVEESAGDSETGTVDVAIEAGDMLMIRVEEEDGCLSNVNQITVTNFVLAYTECEIAITVLDEVAPEITCPEDITIECDESTEPGTLVMETASATYSTQAAIPDNTPAGINTTATIGGIPAGATIDDIRIVDFTMNHTWVGDLILVLSAPTGETLELVNRAGTPPGTFGDSSNGDMAGPISFDDAATDLAEDMGSTLGTTGIVCVDDGICSYAPNDGTTSFASLIADLVGDDPNGTWTINISDNAGGDLGTIFSWNIEIDYSFSPDGGNPDLDVATATDNCDDIEITFVDSTTQVMEGCDAINYQIFRTFIATDASGNADSCVQVITIEDTQAPDLICNTITVETDDRGNITLTDDNLADVIDGTVDACDADFTATFSQLDFDCSDIDPETNQITVDVTAVDCSENDTTCTVMLDVAPALLDYDFACITELNVTLNDDCQAMVIPSMVLSGDLICLDLFDFDIVVMDDDPSNGPIIDGCGRFQYMITEPEPDFDAVAPDPIQGFTGAFAE
ncbi:MAG: hypothetical protein AAGF87_15480, partial [Bacteroidota bacterium]